MIREYIAKLSEGHSLTLDEMKAAMELILDARATPVQIASFLTALHIKGESIEEITGAAMVLREHAETVEGRSDSLDIVGTGGDIGESFCISLSAAIVSAAGGCKVAKHGNRSVTTQCGSADLMEALGVNINCSAKESMEMLDELGFCFLYAHKYHSAMKYVLPVRMEIGIRTIFDVLAPAVNPAFSQKQLLGVYDEELLKPLAQVLINLGVKKGMTVHGLDGTDEISICAPTKICEITDGRIESYTVSPEDFGFVPCDMSEVRVGTPDYNAQAIRDIFSGKEKGAKYNVVSMNAGAALYICGKAKDFREGVVMAREIIDSGKAREKLDQIIEKSSQTGGAFG